MSAIEGSFSLQAVDQGLILTASQDEREFASTGLDRSPAVFTYGNGKLQAGGRSLGRFLVEDRSLLPKPVFFLASGEEAFGEVELEQRGGDRYIIKSGGAPVSVKDGNQLYAYMMGEEEPTEFQVIAQ